ncbi:MAG: molybdopterin-dependent oxidoreductase [Verrucomicrobia bacterium]|nr:molybdopterin-dependent oxidoreductase [Verrucomicrobiota bacterium]
MPSGPDRSFRTLARLLADRLPFEPVSSEPTYNALQRITYLAVIFGAFPPYAGHRLFTRHTLAREFQRHQISLAPFAKPTSMDDVAPDTASKRLQSKFLVYHTIQFDDTDSIDLDEAFHPQTLLAYGFNGGDLPVGFGGPLRMRIPRQLAYKSIKYINRLTVTDNLESTGMMFPNWGYSWYGGI